MCSTVSECSDVPKHHSEVSDWDRRCQCQSVRGAVCQSVHSHHDAAQTGTHTHTKVFYFFLFNWILLFSKDTLNVSNVTMMTFSANYGDPYSEFVLCITHPKCTHTHTHREHTPRAVGSHLCCGARGAVGVSVPCSRAPQSWYWGWRERCTFTPPTYNSCRTETRTHNLCDYESDSLTIRPQLPIIML